MSDNLDELLAEQLMMEQSVESDSMDSGDSEEQHGTRRPRKKERGGGGWVPDDVVFDCQPFALEFHPTHDYVAMGLVDGHVRVYEYGEQFVDEDSDGSGCDGLSARLRLQCHAGAACRALCFSADGALMLSGSSDQSIKVIDLERGAVVRQQRNAHAAAVNVLRVDGPLVASGDDDGTVKLWDTRAPSAAAHSWHENEDYITDLMFAPDQRQLLATGGGGYLAVFSLRKGELYARSDDQDDELLCMSLMRGGRKLAVGTTSGVVSIWSWDRWGDCTDRFVGHPGSVDAMVPLDDGRLVSGGQDGLVRVCSVHPNRIRSVVGDCCGFGVENMALSRDRSLVAAVAHDSCCRFWNVAQLTSANDDTDEADESGEGSIANNTGSNGANERDEDDLSSSSGSAPPDNTAKRKPGKQKMGSRSSFFKGLTD